MLAGRRRREPPRRHSCTLFLSTTRLAKSVTYVPIDPPVGEVQIQGCYHHPSLS